MIIVQYLGGLDTGGAESIVRDYAIELTKRGHKVIVPLYYSTPNLPNQRILSKVGIDMPVSRGIYHRNFLSRGYNKALTILGHDKRFLKSIIQTYKPDVIHLHGYVLKDFDTLDKELDGIKLFYTCHTIPSMMFEGKWAFQKKIADRLIREHGMQMIALHKDMSKEINSIFNISDTLVLNNPINIHKYNNPQKTKVEMRKELGIPEDAFVIGHVGRFDKTKNHAFLIQVFLEILNRRSDAYLLMIGGEGTEKKRIIDAVREQKIENRVRLLTDRSDMPELYNVMDKFVFPSLHEGFGIAMIEAQAAGIQCYCSKEVPTDVVKSELVTRMDLSDGAKKWADIILSDNNMKIYKNNQLRSYDIAGVIDTLISWYQA